MTGRDDRHPLTRTETAWFDEYDRRCTTGLLPEHAARAATLTVFGFDPGADAAEVSA